MNEKLEAVKRERPNVVGYSADLLPRIKGGQEIPGTRCHRIYLSRKLPKDRLPPDALVPISIDGVETDCVVIGELFIASLLPIAVAPTPYTERRDTLIGGISIGHGTITAGTLGAFVKRASQDFMLTNWHVAVGEQGKVGDIIYQPGPYDIQQVYGEEPSEKYAAGLLESFVFPRFGVDAALVVPTRAYDRDAFLSPMALSGIREPAVGMAVLKEGRTTGVTRGIVTDVAAVLSVSYGGGIGVLTFDRLVVIQGNPYLQGGDSGSVTREDSGAPGEQAAVGLNFAGSLQGYGIASPMSRVAQELGF
ncbi:MAG: hypothetical protein Q8N46_05050, partial [Anaerolineales bacterium]|nr:hypothetical protein [Anaerolineales bacterium]